MATKTAKPIVVRVPSMSPATRAKLKSGARRGFSVAARAASSEKHTIAAVGSAALFGFLKRSNVNLPKFDALGTPGTYGLVAWAIGRFAKSTVMQHVATGLMSVSAYELAAGQTLSGAVMGNVMGDEGGEI